MKRSAVLMMMHSHGGDHHEHDRHGDEHWSEKKYSGPLDMETAKEWVHHMTHADGTKGEHWTYDQTTQVMRQRNMECDPVEFYAVINAMWSDYCKVADKYGVNNVDFWADMARAWLMDPDAARNKPAMYYKDIVAH